jgi:hypothetical protein
VKESGCKLESCCNDVAENLLNSQLVSMKKKLTPKPSIDYLCWLETEQNGDLKKNDDEQTLSFKTFKNTSN